MINPVYSRVYSNTSGSNISNIIANKTPAETDNVPDKIC